jgi:hypothetical protein
VLHVPPISSNLILQPLIFGKGWKLWCSSLCSFFQLSVLPPPPQVQILSSAPCSYTGCPRRNVQYFGRVFLMLNYTDITRNTYIQSWTVTEIMAIEKWGLLWCPHTAAVRDAIHVHCA